MFGKLLHTDDSATTIIIKLMVGDVFLSEGMQKFLFADKLGSGPDWAMLLGSIFITIKGGGKWSIDRSLWKQ